MTRAIYLLGLACWGLSPALADAQVRSVELALLGGAEPERFGHNGLSVALSGDGRQAIVGSGHDARIYAADGDAWYEVQRCEAPYDGRHRHPATVAMSSDGLTALVAWPYHRDRPGVVYVFRREGLTWTEEAALVVPDAERAVFGAALALSDDGRVAVIGAPRTHVGRAASAGSVAIFRRGERSWALEATLLSPMPSRGDHFGRAVAIDGSGERVVIGAPNTDRHGADDAGAAFVFDHRGTWSLSASLHAPSPARSDHFGFSVAISSDARAILVGAFEEDRSGRRDVGAVHPFDLRESEWFGSPALVPPDGAGGIRFGRSVAIAADGARALVGSGQSDAVLVLVREEARWREARWLVPEALEGGVHSVGLSRDGRVALLGAASDEVGGRDESGSARVIALSDEHGGGLPSPPAVSEAERAEAVARAALEDDEATARSFANFFVLTPVLVGFGALGYAIPGLIEGIPGTAFPVLSELGVGLLIAVGAIGAIGLPPLLVTAFSGLLGGHGDYRGALAGSAIGGALGIGLGLGGYFLSRADREVQDGYLIGGCVLGAITLGVGTVLGDALWDESERSEPNEVLLIPMVELSPDRGVLGLRGAF